MTIDKVYSKSFYYKKTILPKYIKISKTFSKMPKLPLTDNLSLIMTSQKNLCLLTCLLFELRSTHRERERERSGHLVEWRVHTFSHEHKKSKNYFFEQKQR